MVYFLFILGSPCGGTSLLLPEGPFMRTDSVALHCFTLTYRISWALSLSLIVRSLILTRSHNWGLNFCVDFMIFFSGNIYSYQVSSDLLARAQLNQAVQMIV